MKIETGEVTEILKSYADNTFDAVFCDPPYGLKFMSKKWDYDVPSVALWEEVLRVCKPGAALLAFGGTRTYHRMVVNIEDAGFEIRDQLAWMYGSGFPKSHDVSKAIDKKAGAIREVTGPDPQAGRRNKKTPKFDGVTANYYESAPEVLPTAPSTDSAKQWSGYGTALKPAFEPIVLARKPLEGTVVANVKKWGCGALAIDACRIGTDDKIAPFGSPKQSKGGIMNGTSVAREAFAQNDAGRWPANIILNEDAGVVLDAQAKDASRFFYCAKANKKDRGTGNNHPTVKPSSLCTYLAKLIMPPTAGKILVPFSGSGSEVLGCLKAGWTDVTGIEMDPAYVKIALERINAFSKSA